MAHQEQLGTSPLANRDPEAASRAAKSVAFRGTRPGRPRAQDLDRHVAARLRERRIMLGLTQQQLAELVGITYQQAHKYEKGVNRIAVGRLYALARALGVEPGYFFEGLGTGEPFRPTTQQRQLLDLTQSFAALSRWQQGALAELARALAGAEQG